MDSHPVYGPSYRVPVPMECVVCRHVVVQTPQEAFEVNGWDAPPHFTYHFCPDRRQHSIIDVLVALGSAPRGTSGSIWPAFAPDAP